MGLFSYQCHQQAGRPVCRESFEESYESNSSTTLPQHFQICGDGGYTGVVQDVVDTLPTTQLESLGNDIGACFVVDPAHSRMQLFEVFQLRIRGRGNDRFDASREADQQCKHTDASRSYSLLAKKRPEFTIIVSPCSSAVASAVRPCSLSSDTQAVTPATVIVAAFNQFSWANFPWKRTYLFPRQVFRQLYQVFLFKDGVFSRQAHHHPA
jgi:hypothetical protein